MPIERRHIMLSEAEVRHAVLSYRNVRPDFLPHGDLGQLSIQHAASDSGVRLAIGVVVTYGINRQTLTIEVADLDLIALLIRCCLENNIPIPKAGVKSADVIDGLLTLTIISDDGGSMSTVPAPV